MYPRSLYRPYHFQKRSVENGPSPLGEVTTFTFGEVGKRLTNVCTDLPLRKGKAVRTVYLFRHAFAFGSVAPPSPKGKAHCVNAMVGGVRTKEKCGGIEDFFNDHRSEAQNDPSFSISSRGSYCLKRAKNTHTKT